MIYILFLFALFLFTGCSGSNDGNEYAIDAIDLLNEYQTDNNFNEMETLDLSDYTPDETPESGIEDLFTEEFQCPDPPACPQKLVLGTENVVDENGCAAGYCCTGIEVIIENVTITSGMELRVNGDATITNIGEISIEVANMDCNIVYQVNGSTIAECSRINLISQAPLSMGDSINLHIEPVCRLTSPEPCFDPVDLVCTYSWETVGCYSSGSNTESVTTNFECVE